MPMKWYGDELKKQIHGDLVNKLEKAAYMVEGSAKRLCPVDTGRLRSSISHEVNATKMTAIVGTDVEYAVYQELGTSKMNPKPFLRPGMEENRSAIARLFGR